MLTGIFITFVLSGLSLSVLMVQLLILIVYFIPICIVFSNKDIRDKVSENREI